MSALIDELKSDHVLITETLQKVQKLGISSAEGQAVLIAAKEGLLSHLGKEDAQLYPVLQKHAEQDENLKQELVIFARDMDKISAAALDFFDKYADGGAGLDFARDYGSLVATLSSRIRKEESVLYHRYNEIQGE